MLARTAPLICTKSDGEYTGRINAKFNISGQSYPVVIMPTVTPLALLVLYRALKLADPSRLLLVKLMVYCWASDTLEVTCTAKSDWYLPAAIYPKARSGFA